MTPVNRRVPFAPGVRSMLCNTESQGDLLGDAETTAVAITPFQFNDCVDEFVIRSAATAVKGLLARCQKHSGDGHLDEKNVPFVEVAVSSISELTGRDQLLLDQEMPFSTKGKREGVLYNMRCARDVFGARQGIDRDSAYV